MLFNRVSIALASTIIGSLFAKQQTSSDTEGTVSAFGRISTILT